MGHLPRIIVDLVLFCPHCGNRHVDESRNGEKWHRRAHTTHRCQACGGDFDVYASGAAPAAQNINEAVRIAATEPQINIHTPAEERVQMLAAQIDALEKQLDDERANAIGRASLAEIHAKADVDKHLATIARMQPLVLEAQRVAPMIYSHLCAIRLAYDQDPEVDSKIVDHLDGARSLSQRLDLVGEGYAQACTDAADLDMPF